MDRARDLDEFYRLLNALSENLGGPRRLAHCHGRMAWPAKGVYFFFEPREMRADGMPRVVRVGTHAVTDTSRTTLWNRLSAHRGRLAGTGAGGGNHRGSVFRLHVGEALLSREGVSHPTWGRGQSAPREVRAPELDHERAVSAHLGATSLLWLDVADNAVPELAGNPRAWLERNAIALLSNAERTPLDPPSEGWLGRFAQREAIRASGLWNVNHVHEAHDPALLRELARLVAGTSR